MKVLDQPNVNILSVSIPKEEKEETEGEEGILAAAAPAETPAEE